MWFWYYGFVAEMKWRLGKMGNALAHAFGFKVMRRSEFETLTQTEKSLVVRSGYKLVD